MRVGIAYSESNMLIVFGLKSDCFDYELLVVFSIFMCMWICVMDWFNSGEEKFDSVCWCRLFGYLVPILHTNAIVWQHICGNEAMGYLCLEVFSLITWYLSIMLFMLLSTRNLTDSGDARTLWNAFASNLCNAWRNWIWIHLLVYLMTTDDSVFMMLARIYVLWWNTPLSLNDVGKHVTC